MIVLLLTAGNLPVANAQSGRPVQVKMKLTDGKRIEGKMVLEDLPVILSVFISADDSIAVPVKVIREITFQKDDAPAGRGIRYFNQTFVGIMTGRSNPESSYRSEITAEIINGIRFNTWLWTGAGISFDQYPEVSVLPVIFSLRGDMLKKPFTPFYFFDIGSGPSWIADNQFSEYESSNAGLVYHMGGGLKLYADSSINVMLSFGYKNQEVELTRTLWGGEKEIMSRNYKNFSFRIGIGF